MVPNACPDLGNIHVSVVWTFSAVGVHKYCQIKSKSRILST